MPFTRKSTFGWALLVGVTLCRLVIAQSTTGACESFAPCKLNVNVPEGSVSLVAVTAQGRVVFFVDTGTSGLQLYSVSALGGDPHRLSAPEMQSIRNVTTTPDGRRVIYHARTTSTGPLGLFSVPIGGSTASILHLASGVDNAPFAISPDSRAIVYAPAVGDRLEIVAVDDPDSGGRLTRPFVGDGTISRNFAISADSGSVVYSAPQQTASVELYRVPLTLSPSTDPPTTKLNAPLASGGVTGFQLAPDGSRAIYLASENLSGLIDLHSVRLDGTGRVRLNQPLPQDWGITNPTDIGPNAIARILPDASHVVYQISTQGNQPLQTRFYSVPIAGPPSANVRLDLAVLGTADLNPYLYQLTGDSKNVVYLAVDQNPANSLTHWLFTVPVQGPASASTLMNFPSTEGPGVTISPGGVRVAYTWQGGSAQRRLLFAAPVADPSRTVQINGSEQPLVPLLIETSGTRIVYRGITSGGHHVFSAPLDGVGTRYNLTASLGSVQTFDPRFTRPNGGSRVVYLVTEIATGKSSLYSSPLTPP